MRRQLAEIAGKTFRPRIEIHEQEIGPGLQPDRNQAVILHLEADRVFHAAGADEPAVEVEGPVMVGADDGLAVALAGQQLGSPVAAGIGEGLDLSGAVAGQEYGNARHVGRQKVAGIRQQVAAADEIPDLHEDAFDFDPVESLVGIAPGRQVLRFERRLQHVCVMSGIEHVVDGGHETVLRC